MSEKKLQIKYVSPGTLSGYEKNARTHSPEQVTQISKSISEFGFTNPILVDEKNIIIAGHGRLAAAQQLELKQVPIIVLAGLTEVQRRAYILADNKIALNAGWDDRLLQEEMQFLMAQDFDVGLAGWSDVEIKDILDLDFTGEDEKGSEAANDVPEQNASVPIERGDVFLLGKHRLVCGDATSVDDLHKVMQGQKADLWLTDPPYNVAYVGKTKDALQIKNDSMGDEAFRKFLTDSYAAADAFMRPGAVFYIWHADSEGYNFRGAARDVGWQVRQCLIWKKSIMVMGRQDYHWKHEPCLYGWKDGAAHLWASDRKQTTVLEFDKPHRNEEHPTMKPVELFEYQMLNNTKKGDLVLDSFGGSGTTLIAAERNGRAARIVELDPVYCDVIIRRWQNFTGKLATKEATGETYNLMVNV